MGELISFQDRKEMVTDTELNSFGEASVNALQHMRGVLRPVTTRQIMNLHETIDSAVVSASLLAPREILENHIEEMARQVEDVLASYIDSLPDATEM